MTTWKDAEAMAEKHSQSTGGLFVRLVGDGDKIVGAFCGEPLAREVVWNGATYEPFNPDNPEHTNASLRVRLNFYVVADKAMRVIEGGATWFRDVSHVREKYGLDKWLFEITRHGAAGDPKTVYSILPDAQISPELGAEIVATRLHDLEHAGERTKLPPPPDRPSAAPSDEGIPF